MNKNWFWPNNVPGKIVAIIIMMLFAIRFFPRLENISYYGASAFIIFVSSISIISFFTYISLKEFEKAEIAESLTSPFIGYLIIFMGLYWIFNITSTISSEIIISKTASGFFLLNIIVVSGFSMFFNIKTLSKYISELPIGINKYIPRYKTVPLLSGSIASVLIYFPIPFIIYLLIMIIKSSYDTFLMLQILGLLIFTAFTIILLFKRLETIFWIETICLIISTATFMYFGHQTLFFLIILTYSFIIFGISLLYNLNSFKSNYVIIGILSLPNIIILIIILNDLFPSTLISVLITGIIVPFTTAIMGAYFANYFSKKEIRYSYFTISEASNKINLSRDTIYKLIRNGKLKAQKKGGQWVIEKKDLDEISAANMNCA